MSRRKSTEYGFYEFFAGAGMARLGLEEHWECLFANEWSEKKASSYSTHFNPSPREFAKCDVATLTPKDLPGVATLTWGSFPCQDLSLAGNGAGLAGTRSGTFNPFWKLIRSLEAEKRLPALVVLENVVGTLTSHGGRDFAFLVDQLVLGGYRPGGLVIDAARFLPQSRPRLFIVAVRDDIECPSNLVRQTPSEPWHTEALIRSHSQLSTAARSRWNWWDLPVPLSRQIMLNEVLESDHADVRWHSRAETDRLLAMMSSVNLEKLQKLKRLPGRQVGTIYKRTRPDRLLGMKVQRAEIRCDGIAGCLRTPAGGSSRQIVLVVEGNSVRTRLLTAREAARLMGIPDEYALPDKYNEAYHLAGDGVAVPVVRWLSDKLLVPLIRAQERVVAA